MKKYLKPLTIFMIMLIAIACGQQTQIQNNTDKDFVGTEVAKTLIAAVPTVSAVEVESTSTPELIFGTRENPTPLGQSLDLVKDNNVFFKITVLECIRGAQAWQIIYQANSLNKAPEEGKEYILAKIRVEYTNSTLPDKTLSINSWNFGTISNNQCFEDLFIVNPSPELNVELFPGGVGEGYISGITFKNDQGALLYYKDMFSDFRFYFKVQ